MIHFSYFHIKIILSFNRFLTLKKYIYIYDVYILKFIALHGTIQNNILNVNLIDFESLVSHKAI